MSRDTLKHAVTPSLGVQGIKCRDIRRLWVGGDFSSVQATGVHNTNNCVVLGKTCRGFAVAARVFGVLNSMSGSRG